MQDRIRLDGRTAVVTGAAGVIGVFLGLKHVLPMMLNRNKGSSINSINTFNCRPDRLAGGCGL